MYSVIGSSPSADSASNCWLTARAIFSSTWPKTEIERDLKSFSSIMLLEALLGVSFSSAITDLFTGGAGQIKQQAYQRAGWAAIVVNAYLRNQWKFGAPFGLGAARSLRSQQPRGCSVQQMVQG